MLRRGLTVNRRDFLTLGAAASLFPASAHAGLGCLPPNYFGLQHCSASVPSVEFYGAIQQCEQWCWAACIQTCFATAGRFVKQTDIVRRLYADQRCSPATGPQIVSAVNSGMWRDRYGKLFRAKAFPLADLNFGVINPNVVQQASAELAAGRPMINGAVGHATVLSKISVVQDRWGRFDLTELVVQDPWPGNQRIRYLKPNEVVGSHMLIAIHVG